MEPSLASCLVVMSGGALGTLARYGVTFATMKLSRAVPWGTILCNVTGSFLIGLVAGLTMAITRTPGVENLRLFVMVGFCGGYTTFSSFSLQSFDLLKNGMAGRAAVNIGTSLVICLAAAAFGHATGARLHGAPAPVLVANEVTSMMPGTKS